MLLEAGPLGRYQLRVFGILALGVILSAWGSTEYIFTTARINTRCLISACETNDGGLEFSPSWIANAVPMSGTTFDSCQQYAQISPIGIDVENGTCPSVLFDSQTTVSCRQYVYETKDTIVYEFDLACAEWRRTLIGSLRSVGTMLGFPLCGIASDRWGRRVVLTFGAFITAIIGLLRCLASTYASFVAAEVAETFFGGGAYSCAFILLMETLASKWRIMGASISGTFFALGQATCALVAWGVPQWKLLTLTLYLPQLLTITFLWIMPESLRWMINNGQIDDTVQNLKNIAKVNGNVISEKSLEAFKDSLEHNKSKEVTKTDEQWLIVQVFHNKKILFRCIVGPLWWLSFVFVYYGLSVNAVNISGNKYINFVAVSLVEIPGFWMASFFVTTIGRKPPIVAGFLVCAACQIGYLFIPEDAYGASLAVYLIGKCCIAMVAISSYTFTTELFPTECRHRLFAFCSSIGRIGAVLAPLTPAFGGIIPFILFGSAALVAGLLVCLLPETRGVRLPDTMKDMA